MAGSSTLLTVKADECAPIGHDDAERTEGAWTTEEIMAAVDAGNKVAMKLYYETPDGSVMETTFTGLLGDMGFNAQMAGGEKTKWAITINNTGQHNRVADTTQWLWSSNTDMLWSSGAIMDLLYG